MLIFGPYLFALLQSVFPRIVRIFSFLSEISKAFEHVFRKICIKCPIIFLGTQKVRNFIQIRLNCGQSKTVLLKSLNLVSAQSMQEWKDLKQW